MALSVTWSTSVHLSSDHLPITITFDDETPHPRTTRTFINFKRADWPKYNEEADRLVAALPPPSSCSSGEKAFREAILTAAKHHIPAGYRKDFVPGRCPEVVALQERYDDVRSRDPSDPALADIEVEIKRASAEASRTKWQGFVSSLNRRSNPKRFWNLLANLSGKKKSAPPNQFIRFGDKNFSKPKDIARKFNHHYTNIRKHSSSKDTRKIHRDILKDHPIDHNFKPFSVEEVTDAIKAAKSSTALGPDGLSVIHLKHLGPVARRYLTDLFNLSVANADMPAIWKSALVLPVLKPGKTPTECVSFRPISLLSPASKILERLLLPFLNRHLVLDDSQHGFRAGRSPTSALLPLVTTVANGFNKEKPPLRTVAVAIDISKAFDTVNHDRLLKMLSGSGLPSNIVRWLSCFLRGRQQAVIYQGHKSAFKHIRVGVPQGAVLSPTLFNFFVSDFPTLQCEETSFADDFTIYTSDVYIENAERRLNADLDLITDWAERKDLVIAPDKSTVTLFSSNTHEFSYHPRVYAEEKVDMGGVFGVVRVHRRLPLQQRPRILGVTLDPLLTFATHTREIAKGCTERLKILKSLAGTSWGQDVETLLMTYKATIRSKIDYAAPVWAPIVKPSNLRRLQSIQNTGTRVSLGCVKMTSQDFLHNETKMLEVGEHLQLLSSQYLVSALRESHPAHGIVNHLPRPRALKPTLKTAFLHEVDQFLVDGVTPPDLYNDAKNRIHANFALRAINTRGNNNILQAPHPPSHISERELPRKTRSAINQVRSGFSSSLNSYLVRIGRVDLPSCPQCKAGDHTSVHLFECTSHPTNLQPIDLWRRPSDTATFISSLPSFSHLLPPIPPLPPPPPDPPP